MKYNFLSNFMTRGVFLFGIFFLSFPLLYCSNSKSQGQASSSDEYSSQSLQTEVSQEVDPAVKAENSKYELVVYKSPTCGCCESWVESMEAMGYRLTVHSSDSQLRKMKETLNIDLSLQSCHTSLVEGYIIEGHVHPDSVARLLKERQKIRGLYLPGMVVNSVGMEQPGAPSVRYQILALDYENKKTIYDVYQ